MVEISQKIEASLMIASYLETIGFKNFQRYMKRLYNSNVVEDPNVSGAESN